MLRLSRSYFTARPAATRRVERRLKDALRWWLKLVARARVCFGLAPGSTGGVDKFPSHQPSFSYSCSLPV